MPPCLEEAQIDGWKQEMEYDGSGRVLTSVTEANQPIRNQPIQPQEHRPARHEQQQQSDKPSRSIGRNVIQRRQH